VSVSYSTLNIGSAASGIMIVPGDGTGNVLVTNLGSNPVYLSDQTYVDAGLNPNVNAPLESGATAVFDNQTAVYAACASGQSTTLGIMPGGVSYFEFSELLVKTLIVDSSLGNGIFVYDGTGALGNPPIFSVVAPGTTEDPYGNAVEAVMNIGVLTAAHLGADDSGNLYLADSTGDTRIYMSPSNQLLAFYTADTAGLLMTLAGSAGTDPLTHTGYPEGFKLYNTNGSYVWLFEESGFSLISLGSGAADELNPGKLGVSILGTTPYATVMTLIGPQFDSPNDDYAWIEFQSAYSDGSGNAGGNIIYTDTAGTQHTLLEWGSGGILVNDYSTAGRSYHFQGFMYCTMGTTAAAVNFGVSGPAENYLIGSVKFLTVPASSTALFQVIGSYSTVNSAAYAAGADFVIEFEGTITFTAAGTFGPVIAEHTLGDSFTINSGEVMLQPITGM
jgi:hypothetical protein